MAQRPAFSDQAPPPNMRLLRDKLDFSLNGYLKKLIMSILLTYFAHERYMAAFDLHNNLKNLRTMGKLTNPEIHSGESDRSFALEDAL